jgi:hypothetical protein
VGLGLANYGGVSFCGEFSFDNESGDSEQVNARTWIPLPLIA